MECWSIAAATRSVASNSNRDVSVDFVGACDRWRDWSIRSLWESKVDIYQRGDEGPGGDLGEADLLRGQDGGGRNEEERSLRMREKERKRDKKNKKIKK